jgi:hypothetical protein
MTYEKRLIPRTEKIRSIRIIREPTLKREGRI